MSNIHSYADLKPNAAYALEYEEYLDDIRTAGIVLRHKKSGARIAVLPNDDENKLRTRPERMERETLPGPMPRPARMRSTPFGRN